jgi:hypothetical protein
VRSGTATESTTVHGEPLTGAFSQRRSDFAPTTLVGSSSSIIGKLGSHESDVALITAELQDGPLAGLNVLQGLRNARRRVAAVMLLQNAAPECCEVHSNVARGANLASDEDISIL